MIIKIPNEHLTLYVNRFGIGIDQLDILQEECAELIKACSKYKRCIKNGYIPPEVRDNLIEELTHVAISSEVVAIGRGITKNDILKEVEKKTTKLREELNEND